MPLLQSHVALLLQLPLLLLLITNTAKLVSSRPSAPHCRLHRRAHRGSRRALLLGPRLLGSHHRTASAAHIASALALTAPALHSHIGWSVHQGPRPTPLLPRHSLQTKSPPLPLLRAYNTYAKSLEAGSQILPTHKYGRTSCQAPGENDAHLVRTTHVLAETHAHAKTPYLHSAAAPHLFCVATPLTHAVTAATTTATATATTTANRTRQSHAEPNTSA